MTKGQLEAKLSDIISKYEQEYMGRGPKAIRTYVIGDMIIAKLMGFLSPSELKLTENPNGIELFKKVRTLLFENGREQLEALIKNVIDVEVVSTHSDISTKTGEKIIILTVDRNIEELTSLK
jgi:uncharacterized protein YbcI